MRPSWGRFEGTSDPDDMSVIYALEARDGMRGTLTDACGSYADPAVGAVVDRMGVAPLNPMYRSSDIDDHTHLVESS